MSDTNCAWFDHQVAGRRRRVTCELCYAALNAGVTLGAIYELVAAIAGVPAGGSPYLVVGVLYLIAGATFFVHAWPRIVPFRTLPRPDATASERGE
jgi:hypothetical protein